MTAAEALTCTTLTLRVGFGSLALILVPGVALGYLLARRSFPGRSVLRTVIALPLVLPPVAIGHVLLLTLSRRFAMGRFIEQAFGGPILLTAWAATVAGAVMAFPLLVRAAEEAFSGIPRRLEDVARTLGAPASRVFLSITLPLAARGLVYGAAFALARALGEFGATAIVAGRIPGRTETLALGIHGRIEAFEDGNALILSAISVAIALVITGAAEWSLRRRSS